MMMKKPAKTQLSCVSMSLWSYIKVSFRFKSRSCPHCGVKAGEIWIQYLLSLLPDGEWQHSTFTLPCKF